jgi:hypothetical protein
MKLVGWMLAGSLAAVVALRVWLGAEAGPDLVFGFLGPFVAAAVSWIAMERRYRSRPETLTGLMITAFVAKMLFIGAYVTVVLVTSAVRPVPFAISFTSFFLALHIAEAIGLYRLQAGSLQA